MCKGTNSVCLYSFYPCQICIHGVDNTDLAQLDYIFSLLICLLCGVKSFEDNLKNLKTTTADNNLKNYRDKKFQYQYI